MMVSISKKRLALAILFPLACLFAAAQTAGSFFVDVLFNPL